MTRDLNLSFSLFISFSSVCIECSLSYVYDHLSSHVNYSSMIHVWSLLFVCNESWLCTSCISISFLCEQVQFSKRTFSFLFAWKSMKNSKLSSNIQLENGISSCFLISRFIYWRSFEGSFCYAVKGDKIKLALVMMMHLTNIFLFGEGKNDACTCEYDNDMWYFRRINHE